jgi:serine protease Do
MKGDETMKFFKSSFLWLLFLLVVSPSSAPAMEEAALKQKIVNHLEKIMTTSKIQEPAANTATRSQSGPNHYRAVIKAVVCIATADGSMGSGAVISSRGLIVTNWHVVGKEQIVGVVFKPIASSRRISEDDILWARVLKTDHVRDLALLALESTPPSITSANFGQLSLVEVGQDVFAISHPEGLLWSYTEGVISQIRPKYEWKSDDKSTHRATIIQTQAVATFGSSGAPLFDDSNRMIGIFEGTAGPGLNLAIAVDEVQQFVLSALEKH